MLFVINLEPHSVVQKKELTVMRTRCFSVAVLLVAGAVLLWPAVAAAELKVGINGSIKLDLQYNTRRFDLNTGPAAVPLDVDTTKASTTENVIRDRRDNGETKFDARESRFTITAADKISNVAMKGLIEVDFYGEDAEGNVLTFGSRGPRLFHAFAQADVPMGMNPGYLLIGQTWSYFQNSDIAVPTTVDFNGPAGQLYARQPQLRIGMNIPLDSNNTITFGASVQQQSFSSSSNLTNAFNEAQGHGQDVPLFALKGQWLQEMGYKGEVAFAVSRARFAQDNFPTAGRTATASETVWGVQYSGSYNFGPIEPFLHLQYLSGLNREANGDFVDVAARIVTLDSRLDITAIRTWGGHAGFGYKFTPNTSFNTVFGFNQAFSERDFDFIDAVFKKHRSIHANVMHNFCERWRVGFEYQRFWVKTFNGQTGDVNVFHT